MTDIGPPAWEREQQVEARVEPAFAFQYWTTVRNWTADAGIASVEIDGPFQPGAHGTTHLAGGGEVRWVVVDVEPGCRAAIHMLLAAATLRIEWRFEPATGGGTVLRQRVSLHGPGAATYREQVEAGFGEGMRSGMLLVAKRMEEAVAGVGLDAGQPEP